MGDRTLALIGCCNRELPYFEAAHGKGISVFEFDEKTGDFTLLSEKSGIDNPNYLAIDEATLRVYALSEVWGWNEGVITALQLDRNNATLSYINKQPSLGSICAYVSLDKTRKFAFVANYDWNAEPADGLPGQAVVSYPVREDGSLGAPISSFAHPGTGPHERQEKFHSHYIHVSPDNRFVMVADLGVDKVLVYRFNDQTGELTPAEMPAFDVPPGSGPRHFTFHPSGRFAYVINELNSTIIALSFNASAGTFKQLQIVSALPENFNGDSHSADIHTSPDGRFLYGSNRGDDSLAIFAIDQQTGILTLAGHQSTLGKKPRNFSFDPSGRFVVVANQNSDSLVVFRVDSATGQLSDTGKRVDIGTPMCVKFVRI